MSPFAFRDDFELPLERALDTIERGGRASVPGKDETMSVPYGSMKNVAEGFARLSEAIGTSSRSVQSFSLAAARARARRGRAVRGVLLAACGLLLACSAASKDQLLPVSVEGAASWFKALSPWLEIASGTLGVLTCLTAVVAWVRRRRDPLKVERRADRRELPRACNRRRERGAPPSHPNLDENDPEIRRLLEIAKTPPRKRGRYPSGRGWSGNVPPPNKPTPILQTQPTDWTKYEWPSRLERFPNDAPGEAAILQGSPRRQYRLYRAMVDSIPKGIAQSEYTRRMKWIEAYFTDPATVGEAILYDPVPTYGHPFPMTRMGKSWKQHVDAIYRGFMTANEVKRLEAPTGNRGTK